MSPTEPCGLRAQLLLDRASPCIHSSNAPSLNTCRLKTPYGVHKTHNLKIPVSVGFFQKKDTLFKRVSLDYITNKLSSVSVILVKCIPCSELLVIVFLVIFFSLISLIYFSIVFIEHPNFSAISF